MLKPFRLFALLLVFIINFPKTAFGLSSSLMAQLPTLQPSPSGSIKGSSDDAPLCYIRISGSTVNLHQLCGMPPNQITPNTTVPGTPNVSNRSSAPLSNTLGSNQRAPVSFGTGSAYADDRR